MRTPITIGQLLRQNSQKTFQIHFYWEHYCSECKKQWVELDEEYSLNVSANDIGNTGYDWIFDEHITSVDETTIIITADGHNNGELCLECKTKFEGEFL